MIFVTRISNKVNHFESLYLSIAKKKPRKHNKGNLREIENDNDDYDIVL